MKFKKNFKKIVRIINQIIKSISLYRTLIINISKVVGVVAIIILSLENLYYDSQINQYNSLLENDFKHMRNFDLEYLMADYAQNFNRSDVSYYISSKHPPAYGNLSTVKWYIENVDDVIKDSDKGIEIDISKIQHKKTINNALIILLGLLEIIPIIFETVQFKKRDIR